MWVRNSVNFLTTCFSLKNSVTVSKIERILQLSLEYEKYSISEIGEIWALNYLSVNFNVDLNMEFQGKNNKRVHIYIYFLNNFLFPESNFTT